MSDKYQSMLDEINRRYSPPFDEAFLIRQCIDYTTLCEKLITEDNKLKSDLEATKERLKVATEALDRIRTIYGPIFNGGIVTTINPHQLSRWQVIAEDALNKIKGEI